MELVLLVDNERHCHFRSADEDAGTWGGLFGDTRSARGDRDTKRVLRDTAREKNFSKREHQQADKSGQGDMHHERA